jgi:hypothetical protein
MNEFRDMDQICARQQELIAEVQSHLMRLAELAREEAAVIARKDDEMWLKLDQEIENELGKKERSLGALKEHRKEHGC